ncbi:MAG: DNA-directed RNA polymerase subunit alpha [Calditrichaeota bacterium]|nr:DNA-directed RNA polymerase subunit alpha [Calditrichota bacterium]MCB9472264.1 DNA-directed RNA polymerase subunit alpha [Candidatus Delongbacteria bacterium]
MTGFSPQMPEAIELEESSYSSTYGKFIVQPLERGYGVTLGNAFRRVLLSSIPGAAITQIKVDGVLQEFSSITGVTEDMTDIILNLKQVQIKLLSKRPETLSLHIKGPGTLSAADIQNASQDVEIMNPGLHIATLGKDADIRMEMEIRKGYGYVPAEEHEAGEAPIGTIPIDALYSPVRNVTFRVENTRVGHKTDYERLILEIHTNGTVTPDDALTFAGRTLIEHIQLFINFDMSSEEEPEEEINEEILNIRKLLQKPVEELELTVRAANCIKEAQIRSIGELVGRKESDMLKFKNFGKKSLNELVAVLKSKGLEFGMDISKYVGDGKSQS